MTYNIDSIISELANGKSEGDIAKELSDMLNAAIAQKKQKEAEKEVEEAAARQKAREKEIQRDIELIAESITEYLSDYLYAIDCPNMAEYMDTHYEEMAQELTAVLMNLRTVMPFYDKLLVPQTEEKEAPKTAEKSNARPIVILDTKDSTEYSDKMAEKVLKDFLRQIGK
jgi:hypothetical protein